MSKPFTVSVPKKSPSRITGKRGAWPHTDVDRSVLAEINKKGLRPVRDAGPVALLRRVHLDLTGLPSTAEQVSVFLAQPAHRESRA